MDKRVAGSFLAVDELARVLRNAGGKVEQPLLAVLDVDIAKARSENCDFSVGIGGEGL